jgi:hypothetical protein
MLTFIQSRFLRLLLTLLTWGLPYATLALDTPIPPDSCWQPGFGVPEGTNGEVLAMVWARGNLYIGGRFTAVGGVAARNVARWDGHRWHSLGTGDENGVSYHVDNGRSQGENPAGVRVLAVSPNGDVYVGGEFDRAGWAAVSCLARWDGHQWRAVGDFLHLEDSIQQQRGAQAARQWEQQHRNAVVEESQENVLEVESPPRRQVLALTITATGTLYAGGTFHYAASAYPADTLDSGVACWNGTTWTVPGEGVTGVVRALAQTSGGRVYAGGDFDAKQPDQPEVQGRVACWNGTTWVTIGTSRNYYGAELGEGVAGVVYALAVAPSGMLYAAGASRSYIGEDHQAGDVARWDGHTWQFLGIGPYRGTVGTISALVVTGTHVYAAGDFSYWSAGQPERGSRVAVWDGRIWQPLDPARPTGSRPLLEHYNNVASLVVAPTGAVYVGGRLTGLAPGRRLLTHYLARWTGQRWDHLPQAGAQGLDSEVLAIAVAASGRVYAGGAFSRAGRTAVRSLACWRGGTWAPLPLGCLADSSELPTIAALAVATDGQLYAGARAYTQGPRACRLARWDGRAWHRLGTGLRDNSPTDLADVRVLAADLRGGVYVGGSFGAAGGLPTPNVARWTGTAWQAVGAGLPGWGVTALAIAPNGDLYAAGDLDLREGYSEQLVMRWNGRRWHQVGAFHNNEMYSTSNSQGRIQSLVVAPDGTLYVGGVFTAVSAAGIEVLACNLVRWDGRAWHALTPSSAQEATDNGSGAPLSSSVHSLAVGPRGELYVAGAFEQLGGVAARSVARWDGTAWHALGCGLNGPALVLACASGNRLVVGGCFTAFGNNGAAASHFAVLDPAACQPRGRTITRHSEPSVKRVPSRRPRPAGTPVNP